MRAKSIKSAYDKLQADMSAKLAYFFKEYYPQGFPMVTQCCGAPRTRTVMPFTGTEVLTFHEQVELLDQMEADLSGHVVHFDRIDHWAYPEVVMLKFANYLIDKMREGLIDNYGCRKTSLRTPAAVLAKFIKVYISEYHHCIKPADYYPAQWLKDYFMGVPSSCPIEYANPKIAELAESWGVPTAKADRFAECWFGSCRMLVEHLCDEYDVDVKKIYNEYRKNH